ncbi:MAG: hypothetical protein K0Q71_4128 [Thermomicrobiales bacterium]|jgi:hypothetical protein|nr:hypothetical protein [Thermomicrobiales bacterium]
MATSDSQSRFVATDSLTRDFLTWLTDAPRTYAEAMEVWRTSCPRFSIWEDALAADLIQIMPAPGAPYTRALVVVTPRGRAVLDGSAHAGSSPRTPLA